MRPQGIIQLLRAQPFKPFRITMSDGSAYEVRHPELAFVSRSMVVLGIPGRDESEPADRVVNLALIHITQTEPLDGTAASR